MKTVLLVSTENLRSSYFPQLLSGLEITHSGTGLFLGQVRYAHDILTRASLLDSKSISIPLATSESLTSSCESLTGSTLYRSLVVTLQFLIITCPNMSFIVNHVTQFLQNPIVDHFFAVKRMSRYVKSIIHLGITFSPSSNYDILGVLWRWSGSLCWNASFYLWLLHCFRR